MSQRVTLAESVRFVWQKWREKHPRKCYCGKPLEGDASHCSEECATEQGEWMNS